MKNPMHFDVGDLVLQNVVSAKETVKKGEKRSTEGNTEKEEMYKESKKTIN